MICFVKVWFPDPAACPLEPRDGEVEKHHCCKTQPWSLMVQAIGGQSPFSHVPPRFSLCLFHAVLGERYHRYQCCFQSTAYDAWYGFAWNCEKTKSIDHNNPKSWYHGDIWGYNGTYDHNCMWYIVRMIEDDGIEWYNKNTEYTNIGVKHPQWDFAGIYNQLSDLWVCLKNQWICGYLIFSQKTHIWLPGWWFQHFFYVFHILGIIIPTDFHIFQRGWNRQPDIYIYIFRMNQVWLVDVWSCIQTDEFWVEGRLEEDPYAQTYRHTVYYIVKTWMTFGEW